MEKDAYIFTMHNHHKMEKLDHSLERYFPTLKKIGVRNFFSFLVVALLATGVLLTINQVKQQQETRGSAATLDTNCADATTVPIGALPQQPKPFWCYTNFAQAPVTRVIDQFGGWEDNFNSNIAFGQFGTIAPSSGLPKGNGYFGYIQSSQVDYNIWNNLITANSNEGLKSQGVLHNNHWMFDMTPANTEGGSLISPNKSFKFENGKLVVEADVAAGHGAYPGGGADVFTEMDISTAPGVTIGKSQTEIGRSCGIYASTGTGIFDFNSGQWHTGVCKPADTLYGYGDFPGYWSFGCRLQNTREPVCSLYHPTGFSGCVEGDIPEGDFCVNGARVFEFNPTEVGVHTNSFTLAGVPNQQTAWRRCQPGQDDMFCRDRFRLEIEKTQFTLFVNGIKYFHMSMKPGATIAGLPAGQMFPNEMLNGDNYVYYTNWTSAFNPNAISRFHWDRLAVNPHNADGSIKAPSAAPSYCPNELQQTCPMGMITNPISTPMPTSLVSSTPTPTMAQHTTPTPTTQPTQPPLTGSASMSLQPATQSVPASSAFTVMVHENSGTTPVNATQAVVTYPTALLRFDGFDTTTMQSAFPVMAQQTESGGTITIARGTTTPVSGNQHIVGLKFSVRAPAAANAAITLTSSSVLLSSQTNANVLTQRNNATVNITVTKTGDLNNDNKIDILDLSIFLNKWNSTDSASDMNHDGTVNILDLSILLSQWGK